jgi:hypothetical protein
MQVLKKKRILRGRDVENILATLPESLDATYERVLTGIDPDLMYEARAALQWLSCCARPLYLEELVDACIIKPDDAVKFDEEYRLSGSDLAEVIPALVKIHPQLTDSATVTRSRFHTVSLAHFSVKEYLFSSRILATSARNYYINLELAHTHLARSCLAYISHHLSLTVSHKELQQLSLQHYALRFWEMHAQHAAASFSDEFRAGALRLFWCPVASLMWSNAVGLPEGEEKAGPARHFRVPSGRFSSFVWPRYYLFYRSIILGNEALVRFYLESGLSLAESDVLGSPFKYAVVFSGTSLDGWAQNDKVGFLGGSTVPSSSRSSMPFLLLEYGYRPNTMEFLLAVERCYPRLFKVVVDKMRPLCLSIAVECLRVAVACHNLLNADILMQRLLSGEFSWSRGHTDDHEGVQRPSFALALELAVNVGSRSLVNYFLRYVSNGLLCTLNFDSLFIRATMKGNHDVAQSIKTFTGIRISESALASADEWNSVMPDDHVCGALLETFASLCRPSRSSQRSRADKRGARHLIRPYVSSLGDAAPKRLVDVWLDLRGSFQSPDAGNGCPARSGSLNCGSYPTERIPVAHKLVAYLMLKSHHASATQSACATAIVQHHRLKLLPVGWDGWDLTYRWEPPLSWVDICCMDYDMKISPNFRLPISVVYVMKFWGIHRWEGRKRPVL